MVVEHHAFVAVVAVDAVFVCGLWWVFFNMRDERLALLSPRDDAIPSLRRDYETINSANGELRYAIRLFCNLRNYVIYVFLSCLSLW